MSNFCCIPDSILNGHLTFIIDSQVLQMLFSYILQESSQHVCIISVVMTVPPMKGEKIGENPPVPPPHKIRQKLYPPPTDVPSWGGKPVPPTKIFLGKTLTFNFSLQYPFVSMLAVG